MGIGASTEEKLEGTAVNGMYDKKMKLPHGVVGEQIPNGPLPGPKFLRTPAPRLLAELNAAKGTTEEYAELKMAMVEECGGRSLTGWKAKKVEEVVRRFQSRFEAKGVEVSYNRVEYWVGHGHGGPAGGHPEFRYWLEFTDVHTVTQRMCGKAVSTGEQPTDRCKRTAPEAESPTPARALAARRSLETNGRQSVLAN